MPSIFEQKLRSYAEIVVRVGLNLQRGQRLLITEPYELQGVARSAEIIVEAVRNAALAAGCPDLAGIDVIWGDGPRLREFAAKGDWRGFTRLVAANAATMHRYVRDGDALLFLQGSQPGLMNGIPGEQIAELQRIGWDQFGPVAQQLMQGTTNWTAAPAPSPTWAQTVYSDLPSDQSLSALWDAVFAAMHVMPDEESTDSSSAVQTWQTHLLTLQNERDDLNSRRVKTLRYLGEGTDLTVTLPPEHIWCTAQLKTKSGVSFTANLPTEEVFTLPHRDSATGTVRVARPINYGGMLIAGIELVFQRGVVVEATAATNDAPLQQLFATDEGATRLGEVALVSRPPAFASSGRSFRHPLLDENAFPHIALGDAYGFCLQSPNASATNRSQIHVDLPLDARVSLT